MTTDHSVSKNDGFRGRYRNWWYNSDFIISFQIRSFQQDDGDLLTDHLRHRWKVRKGFPFVNPHSLKRCRLKGSDQFLFVFWWLDLWQHHHSSRPSDTNGSGRSNSVFKRFWRPIPDKVSKGRGYPAERSNGWNLVIISSINSNWRFWDSSTFPCSMMWRSINWIRTDVRVLPDNSHIWSNRVLVVIGALKLVSEWIFIGFSFALINWINCIF